MTTPASRSSVLLFESSLCSQILPTSLVFSVGGRDVFVWSTLCSVRGARVTNAQLTRTDFTIENQVEAQTPAVMLVWFSLFHIRRQRHIQKPVMSLIASGRWCGAGPLGSKRDRVCKPTSRPRRIQAHLKRDGRLFYLEKKDLNLQNVCFLLRNEGNEINNHSFDDGFIYHVHMNSNSSFSVRKSKFYRVWVS